MLHLAELISLIINQYCIQELMVEVDKDGADTNVVVVKFDHLVVQKNMFTGDPVHCTQCNAVLSHISQLKQNDENMASLFFYFTSSQ